MQIKIKYSQFTEITICWTPISVTSSCVYVLADSRQLLLLILFQQEWKSPSAHLVMH